MNVIESGSPINIPDRFHEVTEIRNTGVALKVFLWVAGILSAAVLIWVGLTSSGSPDPDSTGTTPVTALLDIVVLVFREGLECVLVLAALTAGMTRTAYQIHKPIAGGVVVGLFMTLATWFVAVEILEKLSENISALNLQAATGLLAVVVLMVIMNWFLHKVYWGGWIAMHHRRKRALISGEVAGEKKKSTILLGLAVLGFTSVYREGFEIVLFLQTYRLKWGDRVVVVGALIGLVLTASVGVITFIAQRRLPYRKMLVTTGILLGFVLLVMVGEQAQEMQQAHWIPTTTLSWLAPYVPAWTGVWFSLFPTVETIAAQALASVIVMGSFFGSKQIALGGNRL